MPASSGVAERGCDAGWRWGRAPAATSASATVSPTTPSCDALAAELEGDRDGVADDDGRRRRVDSRVQRRGDDVAVVDSDTGSLERPDDVVGLRVTSGRPAVDDDRDLFLSPHEPGDAEYDDECWDDVLRLSMLGLRGSCRASRP